MTQQRFRAYLYDSGKAVDITIYILLTSLELKDDPANHGLLRLLSYVLQTLSADAAFAQCLNQSVRLGVPAKWAVAGTAADFLIVVSYLFVSFMLSCSPTLSHYFVHPSYIIKRLARPTISPADLPKYPESASLQEKEQ